MAVARALGAARIIAVDINPDRLDFAKSYACADVFRPPPKEASESNMTYSKRASTLLMEQLDVKERGSTGIDVVVDATGAESCIQMALLIIRSGGTFVQVSWVLVCRLSWKLGLLTVYIYGFSWVLGQQRYKYQSQCCSRRKWRWKGHSDTAWAYQILFQSPYSCSIRSAWWLRVGLSLRICWQGGSETVNYP